MERIQIAMPNRARRSGFAKKIEAVHWTYGSFQAANLAAGIAAFEVFPAQHLPETLLRMRGEWVAAFNGAVAGGEGVAVSAGMIQVPEGSSTTALWSPITDGDAPWIWWDTFHLLYNEYVASAIGSAMSASARRVIDSKAMRKLRNTEIQFVVEQATVAGFGAGSIEVIGSVRALSGS